MAETPFDIDRIVREVLAELAKASGEAAPVAAPATDVPAAAASTDGELAVTDRVVTMGSIGNRLKAIRRLVVAPGAVLTPAVRDVLRENNIALVRASVDQAGVGSGVRLALVTAFTSFQPAALVDSLRSDDINASVRASDCLIETTTSLAGEIRQSQTLGVILTSQVAAAICLANRLAGVRAVTGDNAEVVAKAADSVGANLLVVQPRGKSPFQLKQIIAAFHRPGKRPCPEALKKQLA
jgi:hypothetical protein